MLQCRHEFSTLSFMQVDLPVGLHDKLVRELCVLFNKSVLTSSITTVNRTSRDGKQQFRDKCIEIVQQLVVTKNQAPFKFRTLRHQPPSPERTCTLPTPIAACTYSSIKVNSILYWELWCWKCACSFWARRLVPKGLELKACLIFRNHQLLDNFYTFVCELLLYVTPVLFVIRYLCCLLYVTSVLFAIRYPCTVCYALPLYFLLYVIPVLFVTQYPCTVRYTLPQHCFLCVTPVLFVVRYPCTVCYALPFTVCCTFPLYCSLYVTLVLFATRYPCTICYMVPLFCRRT